MYLASIEQSNSADWTIVVDAADMGTGDPIDFSGAEIQLVVRDENRCKRLEASTSNGKVTLPATGQIQFHFDESEMSHLQPATYQIGCVYRTDNGTNQLFVGTVSIFDGVARL